jgi:putative endonuclease
VPGSPPELRRSRPLSNRPSGAWGEELALRYLTRRGYVLIERNYRTRYGELDLILRQGNTIAFVEVKLPQGPALGIPSRPSLPANKPPSARWPTDTSSIGD